VNLLVFVVAFSAQWAIGAIIELWPVGADGSYHVMGFRYGFGMMLALQVISLIWFFVATRIMKKDEMITST